jgi:hypothetical protein
MPWQSAVSHCNVSAVGEVRGCICNITHHLLQKATSNLITRLPLPDFNKIDIQRGEEAKSYRRLHGMSRYVQHRDCKRLMLERLSGTIMHENTISRHSNLSLDCIACFVQSPSSTCIFSGRLLFPQVTNCGSLADSGHAPATQIYFRDIIQPAKTSPAISARTVSR